MSRKSRNSSPFSLFAFQDIITSVTGIMILVTMMLTLELLERKEQSPSVRTDELIEQLTQVEQQTAAEIGELEAQLDASADVIQYDSETHRQRIEELTRSTSDLEDEVASLRYQSERTVEDLEAVRNEADEHRSDPETLAQLIAACEELEDDIEEARTTQRLIYNPSEGDSKLAWLVEVEGTRFTVAEVGESAPPRYFNGISEFLGWARGRDRAREYFVLLPRPTGVEAFYEANQTLMQAGFDVGYDLISPDQTPIDPETGAGQ